MGWDVHPLASALKSPLALALVTTRLVVPAFATVTAIFALVVPTTWLPKLRLPGFALRTGLMPVPVRPIVRVPSLEEFWTVIVAERSPVEPGVNVTSTEHEPCAGTTMPPVSCWQVSDDVTTEKSLASAPPTDRPVR